MSDNHRGTIEFARSFLELHPQESIAPEVFINFITVMESLLEKAESLEIKNKYLEEVMSKLQDAAMDKIRSDISNARN